MPRDDPEEGIECCRCHVRYIPHGSIVPSDTSPGCPHCRIAELEAEVTTLKTQRDAFLDTLRHAWVAFQILSGDTFLTFFGSEDSREAAEAARKGMPAG